VPPLVASVHMMWTEPDESCSIQFGALVDAFQSMCRSR